MARAHFIKKARKDRPEHDIKVGESYWWWQFRSGGKGMGRIISMPKQYSKTKPRASQLTRSAYLGTLGDIQDDFNALSADDGLEDAAKEIAGRLNELADEQDEKLENMPDSLKESPTGQTITERSEACRSAAEEIEGINYGDYESDKEDAETEEEYWNRVLDEVQGVSMP